MTLAWAGKTPALFFLAAHVLAALSIEFESAGAVRKGK
jgi:hypothetical protein